MLTSETVKELYKNWLKGVSLRTLAASVGIPHGSLHGRFRKDFGKNACSLKARSLVRSVISDYEGNQDVIDWALTLQNDETTLHRSKHSVNMLTSYQTLRDDYILGQVADASKSSLEEDLDPFGFLRLELTIECFGLLVLDLWNILYDESEVIDEVGYAVE